MTQEFGSGYNLPPGVYEKDLPGWDDPDPVECTGCQNELYPGEECEECGRRAPSVEEMKFDAEEAKAEQDYDTMRDEGLI